MMNACRKIFCVLGLTIALAGAAFAQSVAQTAAAKIDSGCCCGDSCDMTKKDAMKNHADSSDKHECCCCADSCDMKNKKDTKKS